MKRSTNTANEIPGANTGLGVGVAEKSLVVLSPWPGVAQLSLGETCTL